MLPTSTQVCASRAMLLTASRNAGSVVKNGAGDSGHAIRSGRGAVAPEESPDGEPLDGAPLDRELFDEEPAAALEPVCSAPDLFKSGLFKPGLFKLTQPRSRSVSSKYSLVQSPPCRIGTFACTSRAVWVAGDGGGLIHLPACSTTTAASVASNSGVRWLRCPLSPRIKNAAARAVFTTMISNDSPYTPVTVAIRDSGILSTCAIPSRSHGNPVTRVRASSTATHKNGASRST